MILIYKPEGIEPREWDFDPGTIPSTEGEEVERRTGLLFDEWVERAQRGSIIALHAALFVFMRREKPELRWEQVQFTTAEIDWRMTEGEERYLLGMIEQQLAGGRELSETQWETLTDLRSRFPEDGEDAVEQPADVGKRRALTSVVEDPKDDVASSI